MARIDVGSGLLFVFAVTALGCGPKLAAPRTQRTTAADELVGSSTTPAAGEVWLGCSSDGR